MEKEAHKMSKGTIILIILMAKSNKENEYIIVCILLTLQSAHARQRPLCKCDVDHYYSSS